MSWAADVMAIGPELNQLAGCTVLLTELDYGFSVSCGLENRSDGVKLASSQYLDPNDGHWYLMDSKIRDHLTEEQLEKVVTKRLTVAEAQEQLRDYVRKMAGKLH